MAAYLITGAAGSGKTTIIEELSKRGYAAYDTDFNPDVTHWTNIRTGELIEPPIGTAIDFSLYDRLWQKDGLQTLVQSAPIVFIGDVVGNQSDFYYLFDKVFVLALDADSQRHRLLTRTSHDFGKDPKELADAIGWQPVLERKVLSHGGVAIDSTRSATAAANDILRYVGVN